jgi:hypothetical protein
MQDHTALYHSYPPQPEVPRPYHLLPSATAEAQRAEALEEESTEDDRAAEDRARANNSSESSVELSDDMPLIPRRRREMRKHKASVADLAG